ncbi:phage protein NinX family protein [Proteus vulgaris]|uniref:phage protein NinX family protein n=1 Tax=Proteus vulgaris TaxID=585 RepID=UPI0035233152
MNSYNKYTDLQINELVATRLKKKCLLTEESVLAYMDSGYRTFDPCNNPADAMSIIIDNLISLMADMSEDGGSTWWCASDISNGITSRYKSNPLRAAMEVFLMIKDAENEG